jgi:hypothetical protein
MIRRSSSEHCRQVIDRSRVVFRDEWWHHRFATRVLAVIYSD